MVELTIDCSCDLLIRIYRATGYEFEGIEDASHRFCCGWQGFLIQPTDSFCALDHLKALQ